MTTSGRHDVTTGPVGDDRAPALASFAAQRPLEYADFASIAILQPAEPRVWTAWDAGHVVAAAIDDGLAMSVAGEQDALRDLAACVDGVTEKLVIAGRTPEVTAFVGDAAAERRERPEHFMAVARGSLTSEPEPTELRVAASHDLPLLEAVRARALEEEYGIEVPPESALYQELARAVGRAVAMQGVAIWVEDGKVAFTAQLIAKTTDAAMFGDLYTDPALRGAGRATKGLTAFCAWLMSESQHVTLRVGTNNDPAVRLYERVGFDVIDSFMSSLRSDGPGGLPG
jgi:predicted GNAT family acetyltransferase